MCRMLGLVFHGPVPIAGQLKLLLSPKPQTQAAAPAEDLMLWGFCGQ